MFFEECINFLIFCYLRHCGVIPVQSLRSHIHPQPSGLGLIMFIRGAKWISYFCCVPFVFGQFCKFFSKEVKKRDEDELQ
jgi:hypothetical protein